MSFAKETFESEQEAVEIQGASLEWYANRKRHTGLKWARPSTKVLQSPSCWYRCVARVQNNGSLHLKFWQFLQQKSYVLHKIRSFGDDVLKFSKRQLVVFIQVRFQQDLQKGKKTVLANSRENTSKKIFFPCKFSLMSELFLTLKSNSADIHQFLLCFLVVRLQRPGVSEGTHSFFFHCHKIKFF